MLIDGCPHSFKQLADEMLPSDMTRMRVALASSLPMKNLVKGGKASILRELKKRADFPGCYVLIENDTPFYVGISRGVVARLIQHVRGKTHFDASLAYRMACTSSPHKLRRSEAMKDAAFSRAFQSEQQRIRNMRAAVIEIREDLELYLFEVYCALELGTAEHNSFRTH
jgi:predicted GIY-YIG superfamily endonuclease